MYTWENGTLNVSDSYGKRVNVQEMISATSGEENAILKEMIIIMMKKSQTCEVNA